MEAKELRIGNFLHFKGSDMVAVVSLINAPKHFDCRDEYGSFCPNGSYQPIILTEKWLLKFGFINQMGCMWTNKITLRNGIKGKYELRVSDGLNFMLVKHVHQLQNLYFALTGEELTDIE